MEKFKAKDLNLVKTMIRNDKDLERSQVLIKYEQYLLYKKLPTLYAPFREFTKLESGWIIESMLFENLYKDD